MNLLILPMKKVDRQGSNFAHRLSFQDKIFSGFKKSNFICHYGNFILGLAAAHAQNREIHSEKSDSKRGILSMNSRLFPHSANVGKVRKCFGRLAKKDGEKKKKNLERKCKIPSFSLLLPRRKRFKYYESALPVRPPGRRDASDTKNSGKFLQRHVRPNIWAESEEGKRWLSLLFPTESARIKIFRKMQKLEETRVLSRCGDELVYVRS